MFLFIYLQDKSYSINQPQNLLKSSSKDQSGDENLVNQLSKLQNYLKFKIVKLRLQF